MSSTPGASFRVTISPLILVVDDNDDNREMYAGYLQWAGFRVTKATNGHEALVAARIHHPAVVVLDIYMPGIDGWEVCRLLKANSATSHCSIIMLTGDAFTRPADAECDAYLLKPCLPDTLLAEVRRQLELRGHRSSGPSTDDLV
ncbi:MAG: response regulator [Candidatus Rokuibacteriota bacterium]